MQSDQTATAEVLQELNLFVNDRIEGYRTAAAETTDPQHQNYYEQLAHQSNLFSNTINGYLRTLNAEPETGTTIKGKLYRGWMDTKAALTGRDEAAILSSNLYGEEWALKAYNEALTSPDLPADIRQTIERQKYASQQNLPQAEKQ